MRFLDHRSRFLAAASVAWMLSGVPASAQECATPPVLEMGSDEVDRAIAAKYSAACPRLWKLVGFREHVYACPMTNRRDDGDGLETSQNDKARDAAIDLAFAEGFRSVHGGYGDDLLAAFSLMSGTSFVAVLTTRDGSRVAVAAKKSELTLRPQTVAGAANLIWLKANPGRMSEPPCPDKAEQVGDDFVLKEVEAPGNEGNYVRDYRVTGNGTVTSTRQRPSRKVYPNLD